MSEHDKYPAIIVRGAPFTFRTLHGPDRRRVNQYDNDGENTLDQLVTITLAAMGRKVTREVVL